MFKVQHIFFCFTYLIDPLFCRIIEIIPEVQEPLNFLLPHGNIVIFAAGIGCSTVVPVLFSALVCVAFFLIAAGSFAFFSHREGIKFKLFSQNYRFGAIALVVWLFIHLPTAMKSLFHFQF